VAITEQAASELELAADLAELVHLVDEGRVDEARRLAPELAARWPESRPIQHRNRVLEPPKVRFPALPGFGGATWTGNTPGSANTPTSTPAAGSASIRSLASALALDSPLQQHARHHSQRPEDLLERGRG
jgi:hypothetical protein